MKTKELIKKLQEIVKQDPDSNTVITFEGGFTTDIEVGCDDENTAEIYVIGGAKQY